MIIQRMRAYFLYNVPVTENLMLNHEDNSSLGVPPKLIEMMGQHFQVQPIDAPAFYTNHYRQEHTPYAITDNHIPKQTVIPKEKLKTIDFYADLNLTEDIILKWDFSLSLQSTGLVTICLLVDEPVPCHLAYRLGGLHLNPNYAVIATEPVKHFWADDPNSHAPYVSLDDLARVIHQHFFRACGLNARRYRALQHEIQIPLMAVEVETDYGSQSEFVEKEVRNLAELVFKPACWEVETASMAHAQRILDDSRVWSVARDTFVIVAYEGALYVKLKTFDTGAAYRVSGFDLADETSVLYSFKVAVSNYHFLRILDDLLDKEVGKLKKVVDRFQLTLRDLFQPDSTGNDAVLQEMNEFAIQVTNLQFQLTDLLEEINNSDKLIDEEWHIVLLDKLNAALGTKIWFNSIHSRVNNLRDLVETVENTYERLLNLTVNRSIANVNERLLEMTIEDRKVESRLKKVQPVFEAVAAAELIGLMIIILFDDNDPMVVKMGRWLNLPVGLSHVVNAIVITLLLYFLIRGIRWWANRGPDQAD